MKLTAKIVSAHTGRNQVAPDALPKLIQAVHHSLATAGRAELAPPTLTPAVPIRKSAFPDHIVCLEDGKKLKTLKGHLQGSHRLTPEQYRLKWGLPTDYRMVAPNYASHRSNLAKQLGLGRKPRGSTPEQTSPTTQSAEPEQVAEPPVIKGRARRARGSKG